MAGRPAPKRHPRVSSTSALSSVAYSAAKRHLVGLPKAADPDEVAEAALWPCSDRVSFVTGAVLPVDGGYTAVAPYVGRD